MFFDIFFATVDKPSFEADALLAGLYFIPSSSFISSSGEFPNVSQSVIWETGSMQLKPGVNVDYVGRMVKTPPVIEFNGTDIVIKADAVYYDGERAVGVKA